MKILKKTYNTHHLKKIISFNLGNTKAQLGQKLLKECKKENPNIYLIKELLACGADTNTRNDNGWTALMCASFKGNAGIVRMLLAAEADLSAENDFGETALWKASYFGHTETVRVLLAAGADPNAARTTDGATALIWASIRGNADVVRLLLEAKSDPNAARDDGLTPLITASHNGHTETVRVLLAYGADPNAARRGNTSLMLASLRGHKEIARVLLAAGADPNAVRDNGETALMMASSRIHAEIARVLLKALYIWTNDPDSYRGQINAEFKTNNIDALSQLLGLKPLDNKTISGQLQELRDLSNPTLGKPKWENDQEEASDIGLIEGVAMHGIRKRDESSLLKYCISILLQNPTLMRPAIERSQTQEKLQDSLIRMISKGWTSKDHHLYSLEFKEVVRTVHLIFNRLSIRNTNQKSPNLLPALPLEMWQRYLKALLPDDFEGRKSNASLGGAAAAGGPG